MSALLETQRAFARALVADHPVDVLRRIVRDRMRPERRLAVHRQTFESALTNALRWEMDWIDDRVAGGDKLREEWREKARQRTSQAAQ